MSNNDIAALFWLCVFVFVGYKIFRKKSVDEAIGWVLFMIVKAGVAVAGAFLILWGLIRLIRWMWDTSIF